MTSTKESRARQYGLNAPDCLFIGHCSCCERGAVIDKPSTSAGPAEVPGSARAPAKRQMRARPNRAKPEAAP
jgi:hypothetical protein